MRKYAQAEHKFQDSNKSKSREQKWEHVVYWVIEENDYNEI